MTYSTRKLPLMRVTYFLFFFPVKAPVYASESGFVSVHASSFNL